MLDLPPVRDPMPSEPPPATLVRPRPPAEPPRPSLPAVAVAVAGLGAATSMTITRVPMPQVRLAPPSGPTLTRPPASALPAGVAATSDRARGQEGGAPSPADDGTPGAATGGDPGAATGGQPEATGPCAGQRRLVDERCALAGVARDQARAAADTLHEAQRAYDILRERVDRAAATAEPRRVAAEKDRLHAAFRDASDRAGSPDETEAAARAWLDDLNALNAAVREAARIVENGAAELRGALPALERRSAEADVGPDRRRERRGRLPRGARGPGRVRGGGDPRADRASAGARGAAPVRRGVAVLRPARARGARPDRPARRPARDRPDPARGSRGARAAGRRAVRRTTPTSRSDWQLRISRLVDAITGRAIEDGYLDMPDDDPFWRLFEYRESRDIVGALSALGFRYDGMGGFADGRVPAARDLSLAVGYAGLDRMRIRTWPREGDLAGLYSRATVASDQWLAEQAGDLSLGRMVDALGARAAELADVWNAWGRVRPALLEE